MGGKNSTVIDPNNTPTPNNNSKNIPPAQIQRIMQIIQEAFRNVAQNGSLSRDKFNQALSILQVLGFKRLRDTPLADSLFYVFDKSSTGQISQKQFSSGIKDIIADKQNAINYSFRAIDRDRDNFISRKQYMNFVEQSWKAAFRIVWQNSNGKKDLRLADIQNWSTSKIQMLNKHSSQIFNQITGGNDRADYQSFRNFLLRQNHTSELTASLDGINVIVPLDLTKLQ